MAMDPAFSSGPAFERLPSFSSAHDILAEECGWQIGCSKFLQEGEMHNSQLIVTERGFLGKGAVGIVEEVQVEGFEETFARKRVMLSKGKQAAIRDRMDVKSEIENLKSLDHYNIVKILGCYEEQWGRTPTICVLMFPAGDADLEHFLYEECQPPVSVQHRHWIRFWIDALASALAYMHAEGIHHEDIKPTNIVHRGAQILFTDFSSSRRLEAGQTTSTESSAKASRLFAAPEAMCEDGKVFRHGSKSDVFSLGLVYVEMFTVLVGKTVDEMRDFVFEGETQARRYCRATDRIFEFLGPRSCRNWEKSWESFIKEILHPKRRLRPSAEEIFYKLEDSGLWDVEL
jgi:serine/threonine protein kinase